MRRSFHIAGAGLCLGVAAFGLLAGPAHATPGYGTATLPTQVEAWYWTFGCTNAIGCGTVAPPQDPYPADTLHVGTVGGQDTEATFVTLDTGRLPAGSVVTQATMDLPVSTDAQAGTFDASAAEILVCPATGPFPSAQFASYAPPTTDCRAGVDAKYHPGAGEPYFSVDLSSLLKSTGGTLDGVGVGLVPDPAQATGTWHVSFNGRLRNLAGEAPITVSVTYRPGAPAPANGISVPSVTTATTAAGAAPPAPAPVAVGPDQAPTGQPVSAPAPAGGSVAPPTTTAVPSQGPTPAAAAPDARPAAVIRGGQYGTWWVVPLALLGLGWLIVSVATRDLRSYVPARRWPD